MTGGCRDSCGASTSGSKMGSLYTAPYVLQTSAQRVQCRFKRRTSSGSEWSCIVDTLLNLRSPLSRRCQQGRAVLLKVKLAVEYWVLEPMYKIRCRAYGASSNLPSLMWRCGVLVLVWLIHPLTRVRSNEVWRAIGLKRILAKRRRKLRCLRVNSSNDCDNVERRILWCGWCRSVLCRLSRASSYTKE